MKSARAARSTAATASYVGRNWDGLVDLEERMCGAPELASRWHTSRATGKRELFERVEKCGTTEAHKITLVCRGCSSHIELDVGCNSHWFCAECRSRTAQKFRVDFERKRLGLIAAATRAGLTRRRQKKSERWGERLATFTIPHVGNAGERVRTLRATWSRFWRTLREELRPALQRRSGITLLDLPNGMTEAAVLRRPRQAVKSFERYEVLRAASRKIGPLEWKKRIEFFPLERDVRLQSDIGIELSLWDMLSYLHVFEWTPGEDGEGHPHMHVWLFSRYIEQELLEQLWRKAYAHVTEQEWTEIPRLVVDVRAARSDVAHELVKYLTKDWEVEAGTARRVRPEIFAQVYAELDGKRMRQSSAGFSMWGVGKVCACPACGFEAARSHWAKIEIVHALEGETITEPLDPAELSETRGAPLTAAPSTQEDLERLEAFRIRQALAKLPSRGSELRAAWLAARRKQKGTR